MVSLSSFIALFKRKSNSKSSSLRVWVLYILFSAASARYLYYSQSFALWKTWGLSASLRGSPVLLTHGNESAVVGRDGGVSVLDVVKACPSLYGERARYRAPWWMFSGNVQTMWNTLGDHTKTDVIPYHRLYLRVPDNGTLVLDTYPPLSDPTLPADTPIVVILHGITGSSQEAYTRATVSAVARLGWRAVVLNFRGCDGSPVTSSRLYHAGETDDFRSVLLYLSHTYPSAPVYAVGFSMGASTLAVYLGQQEGDTVIKAGVCVSNPWDWVEAANWIETGSLMNRFVYGPVLADALKTIFLRNVHAFPRHVWGIDIPEVEDKKYFNIRWYDDRVTSKIFGFRDAHDYYTQTSSKQYIPKIQTPLLSLHAKDDPIVAPYYLPWKEVQQTKWIVMASTEGGGHVGWFQHGVDGFLKRWYTDPIVEFLQRMHQVDPLRNPAPPMTAPDAEGFIHQANFSSGQSVGFLPFEGEAFSSNTSTGRSIQGF